MISREEAIKELKLKRTAAKSILDSLPPKTREKSALNDEVEMLTMAIEALSNERPKGRWIGEVIYTEIGEEHAMQECSGCGKIRIIDNFCPNCGAEMVRGEEE